MSPPGRPLRADAQRNRENLVAVAREAFATAGTAVPLEAIAREAGVGIGTLYRHFPTREALFEAVYAAELDDITTSAPALLGELPPDTALRAWLGRYAQFVAMKRGMVDALRTGVAAGRITPPARERITGAVAMFLEAGVRVGALRDDVDPGDVTAMLLGVLLATTPDSTPDQAGRLLDLVVDAVRPGKSRAPTGS